ncbi:beta-ketoacyl-[acyl-carrier-protein] synthase family protein [Streptomyces sp. NPDC048484]|uniref:beta-ketoacyl-[acyl-carrier-protein] synthase family protein n=1 Tax=Streptomyces sp. NPDC048484 TaxID=3155146 RepID=UPI00341FD503
MSRGVAVTGMGLVTPAGIGVADNWDTLCRGVGTAAPDPELEGAPVSFSCRVPSFDAEAEFGAREAWRLDRFVQLGLLAAREALADSGLDSCRWDGARVGVVMGCAAGGVASQERHHAGFLARGPKGVSALFHPKVLSNMVSGRMAIEFDARGPNLVVSTACASGATAIGLARDLLLAGSCDVVLAGGTEAAVTPTFVTGFTRMGALSGREEDPPSASRPFDTDRDGFVIAEGAGVLVLERPADARARGAALHGHVAGYGASADAVHVTSPDPEGRGLERAIRDALTSGGLTAREVGHVNAHGTSTLLNDRTEAEVIGRVLGETVAVSSTKGVTGHTLGAAGAVEAAYALLSIAHETVPPTANLQHQDPAIDVDIVAGTPRRTPLACALSNSSGFGGHNVALLLTA